MRTGNCLVCESGVKRTLAQQTFKDDYLELIEPRYQLAERRLVACEQCGLVFHDPQLDDRDIVKLYERFRDLSFRGEAPDAYFDRITSLPDAQSENFAKVSWMRDRLSDRLSRVGSLLDVGCGGGVFIHTFLKRVTGWTAAGVEPTPAFAELAGRRLRLPVIAAGYRSGLFAPRRFDLITVNHVLEHVVDPIGFLADLRNDLAESGLVYLEVPDVEDFGHLDPAHDRFQMQHLWIFSEPSLSNVCERAGFAVSTLEHQLTVRDKRNIVVVLSPRPIGRAEALTLRRDNVERLVVSAAARLEPIAR
jgi:SAM-dependent methyltransferase